MNNIETLPLAALAQAIDALVEAKLRALLKEMRIGEPELTTRGLRLIGGYTIDQLAKRSGVAPSAISNIENGKIKNPEPATLNKIARGLGVAERIYREAVARSLNK